MQTQCPHCKSRYHIAQEMIDKFGGFVRCGNCQYKFNVHDQVSSNEPLLDTNQFDTAKQPQQADLLDPTVRVEPKLDGIKDAPEVNIRFTDREDNLPTDGVEKEANNEIEKGVKAAYEPMLDTDFTKEASMDDVLASISEADSNEDYLNEQFSEENHSSLGTTSSNGYFTSNMDSQYGDESSVLSLINEDAEEGGDGFFQKLFATVKRLFVFFFWTFLAVALAYILFGQIKNTLYPAYKDHHVVQKIRASVCQFAPCGAILNDLSKYEIAFSRMEEINQDGRKIQIKLFILNKALAEQIYPNILIRLTKLDGSTAGQRVLNPLEYLDKSEESAVSVISGARFIKPGKLAPVLIVFDNPPEETNGFEVRLVH